MEKLIKDFNELGKSDVTIAGGKGASLGEMTQAGISVPDGFVVLASAFEKFLEETDLNVEIDSILDEVKHEQISTVEDASGKIQSLILQSKMSQDIATKIQRSFKSLNSRYVAVRSSSTAEDSASAAWAGQLESYLNTTEENLVENVKKCWASLFTPRAIFYRFEKDLHKQKISVAVVVQKMVESKKSGIAFSVHPVTQDRNQLIIEAGFGLGEAIVSGQITPDSYVIEKQPRRIIDKNIQTQAKGLYCAEKGGNEWRDIPKTQGEKEVLSDEEIFKLSEIILKIENHYGFPCDIEWAFENGKFYITQSRPITTLQATKPKEAKDSGNDYELHFTVSEFSILTLDMIFNNNETYGAVDYVVLYENDITRAYLSPKGVKECYYISTSLLNDEFADGLFAKSEKLDKKLKSYHLNHLDEKNLDKEWEKGMSLNNEFCGLYRFYEQPFQQALEQEILKSISKDELIEILSHDSFDKLPDEKTKKYVERLLEMGKVKLRLHEDSEKSFTNGVFLRHVSEKHSLLMRTAGAMRLDEFEEALRGKLTVTFDELEERLKGSVFVKENNKWNLYTGEQFEYWKNKMQGTHNGEVVGDIAFSGVAKGRVVIHLSWTGITEIEEGDVLVTGMTNPQMIPMLKKASAIVTDEGGITCHAAIISRELRKPCIVGTKNATQVLNNGDLVEVNANDGFVHIIKKSKNK